MELKEYIITLHKHEDLDDFYQDMETPGGNLYIPDRVVEIVNRRPISRNTHYWLTEKEALEVASDPRVRDVSLTYKDLGIIPVPFWSQSGNFVKAWSNIPSLENTDKNWGLYRVLNGNRVNGWGHINGNLGEADRATIVQSQSINYKIEGKNVDVVIVDEHVDPNHPEFSINNDGSGGSRVNQFNWFSLNPTVTGGSAGNYSYSTLGNHGTHVAGIAAGNSQGWARKSNIYNINPLNPYVVPTETIYDYIRTWHNTIKTVNPETGVKNPTICNNSWGFGFNVCSLSDLQAAGGYYVNGNFSQMPGATGVIYNKGTTYTGPWTVDGQYDPPNKVWKDFGFPTNPEPFFSTKVFYCLSSPLTSFLSDLEDAINDGIFIVWAAGNDSRLADISGGQDIDNRIYINGGPFGNGTYYINRHSTLGKKENNIDKIVVVGNISSDLDPSNGNNNEWTSSSSTRGPFVDLWAPGTGIISSVTTEEGSGFYGRTTDPRNSSYYIASASGTSMASPQVAGVMACILELNPTFTVSALKNYLLSIASINQVDLSQASTNAYDDLFSLQGALNKFLYAPNPTFSVSVDNTTITTGQTVTYTFTTTNVPNGSTLYLTEGGTSSAGDFNDGFTSTTITINNNTGSLARTISSSYTGGRITSLQVRTGGYSGTIQTTAQSVTLNSTGGNPNPGPNTNIPIGKGTLSMAKISISKIRF